MSATATRRPAGPPGSASSPPRPRVLVIVGLFVVAVVAAAFVGWRFARESTPVTGPIVLIAIDPLRADHLSFYGGGVPTPHLDRLAAGATVFTTARAHAASSLPAHASLLTGALPRDHGVRDDVGYTLPSQRQTLASRLANRGFATGAAVSTWLLRPATGINAGVTDYDATLPPPPDGTVTPAVERDSAATARVAAAWLDAQDSERFFYTVQLNGEAPPDGDSATAHARGIAHADAAVGSVLDTLRRKGWYDDALIIVTSTYGGPADGAHDPGRGFTLAAPVMRVPLVIKMPGAEAAERIDAAVQHIDLVPTVLDLVRAPSGGDLRGRSFRHVLEGDGEMAAPATASAEALSGSLRFGWAPLVEPAGDASTPAAPQLAAASDREAFAVLGQVVPTILPRADAASEDQPSAEAITAVLAAYRRAARHDAEREFAEAVRGYRAVVALRPAQADAWHRLAIAAARLGRTDEALRAFTEVATRRPDLPQVQLSAAQVEVDAGHIDAAMSRLTALATAEPAPAATVVASAEWQLAALALARKRPVEARAHAARAESADAALPAVALVDARLLLDGQQYDKALTALDAVAETTADRTAPIDGLQWQRGVCLAALDRDAEAVTAFERAITDAPFDVRAYVSLAALHHQAGREDAARDTLDTLLRAVPTPAGYTAAARIATTLGDSARASELRASARQRFAADPPAAR